MSETKPNPFQKATKYESRLRMAIAGPSGSGKTWTSLAIAEALGGKVALVDTEHGSAAKYADAYDFDTLALEPPYHPDRYVAAIQAAVNAQYNVLILDSLSHAWSGTGGLLEVVEQIAMRLKGNTFAPWKDATPIQNRFVEAIVSAPLHIIATLRSKQDYVLEADKDGKTRPRKVGMAPIQREGLEYEFDVVAEMDWDNNLLITKTRCPALAQKVFSKPTGQEITQILLAWLQGQPAPVQPKSEANSKHWIDNEATRRKFWARMGELGLSDRDVYQLMGIERIHDYPGTLEQFGADLKAAMARAQAAQDKADLFGEA